MFHIKVIPRTLTFKQPAGTSRGVYNIRQVWYIQVSSLEDPSHTGYGECAPLPDLSCDASSGYMETLLKHCFETENKGRIDKEALRSYPSIMFGLETAMRHFEMKSYALWNTSFSRGEVGIPINGLIWMGEYNTMLQRIEEKIQSGYRCVKLKIGAINFNDELKLLKHIRAHFSAKEIELRVDANGAFSPHDAPEKLNLLAELDLHSIEQPIKAGQWEEMAKLTEKTPLPIALDEELIGINDPKEKERLLDTIRPQYIILKPSLHGGIYGSEEWIEIFERISPSKEKKWWVTSALESNIGLNSIAQWCATLDNPLPQGLGTGLLFTDNVPVPLEIRKDRLWYNPS